MSLGHSDKAAERGLDPAYKLRGAATVSEGIADTTAAIKAGAATGSDTCCSKPAIGTSQASARRTVWEPDVAMQFDFEGSMFGTMTAGFPGFLLVKGGTKVTQAGLSEMDVAKRKIRSVELREANPSFCTLLSS